jgi:hypothetical protein
MWHTYLPSRGEVRTSAFNCFHCYSIWYRIKCLDAEGVPSFELTHGCLLYWPRTLLDSWCIPDLTWPDRVLPQCSDLALSYICTHSVIRWYTSTAADTASLNIRIWNQPYFQQTLTHFRNVSWNSLPRPRLFTIQQQMSCNFTYSCKICNTMYHYDTLCYTYETVKAVDLQLHAFLTSALDGGEW